MTMTETDLDMAIEGSLLEMYGDDTGWHMDEHGQRFCVRDGQRMFSTPVEPVGVRDGDIWVC